MRETGLALARDRRIWGLQGSKGLDHPFFPFFSFFFFFFFGFSVIGGH